MNIFGIGTDIIEVKRVQKASERNKMFLERIFTKAESDYCSTKKDPYVHFAGRFAAKEAVSKAFGIQANGVDFFQDIEILNDTQGAPYVVLHGRMLEEFRKKRLKEVKVSISGIRDYAIATALTLFKQ